jgi:hypothetical protein
MTSKPQAFKSISRCIDKHEVHHLDAIDGFGRHWYAAMKQGSPEEPWLIYTKHWELKMH